MEVKRKLSTMIVSIMAIFLLITSHLLTTVQTIDNGGNSNYNNNGKLIRIAGDIILGGIFPMHEHISENRDYPCGQIKEEKGIQRLEAMLFAIDRINNDPRLLKNITLGSVVIDSCSSDTYALEQSMEFVRYYMNKVRFNYHYIHIYYYLMIFPKRTPTHTTTYLFDF